MTLVFINYRGSDSAWAVMLDRELSRQFGSDRVFQASRSIPVGADFTEWLMDHLRRSSVLLAIIGPNWSAATDRSGRRLLLDEKDWVRREIAGAFTLGIPVIPVLVDEAPRLDSAELPSEIARLARCQYLRLNYRNATYDVLRLIDELVRLVPDLHLPAETSRSGLPTPRQAGTDRADPAESSPTAPATHGRRRTLTWSFIALVVLLVAVLTATNLGKWNTSPPGETAGTPPTLTAATTTPPASTKTTHPTEPELLHQEAELKLTLHMNADPVQQRWHFLPWERGLDEESDMEVIRKSGENHLTLMPTGALAVLMEQADFYSSRPCVERTDYSSRMIVLEKGQLICLRRDGESIVMLRVDDLSPTAQPPTVLFVAKVWRLPSVS